MKNLTRRGLLKTGLAASAGFISPLGPLGAESASAEIVNAGNDGRSFLEPGPGQASSRERLLLDFGWRFHLGNTDDASKDFSYGLPAVEGTFAKSGQIVGHNVERSGRVTQLPRDDSGWQTVDLPHDWAIDLPFTSVPEPFTSAHAAHGDKPLGRAFPETSIGWYRRRFEIPASDQGRRLSLEFDGIFRDSMIVVNGFYMGKNFSGYLPCSFDITDVVNYGGDNLIEVRVDATLSESWAYEGAGIYRHTWLVKTHPLHIAKWGTCVRSEVRGAGANVAIETELVNDSDDVVQGQVVSRIYDPRGNVVSAISGKAFTISAWKTSTVKDQISLARPALWSLEEPNLYRVVSQVQSAGKPVDKDETTFGVRTIRFDADRGFFLNGKSVKIKGTCNHQDHGGLGIAVPDRIQYERVAVLKQMGSNGWRTAHNPVATELLDACDQLGMMVMSEVRLMSSSPEGLSELERMVRRDRNHPSIIVWSLANEEHYQSTEAGARIVTSMKRLCKELDPSRLVTGAMNVGWEKGISNVVDVQGFNYWNNDQGSPRNIDAFHAHYPKLPLVGTETANGKSARGIYETDARRGYVSGTDVSCAGCPRPAEIWWTLYSEREFLSGGFTWAGFDYRGEPKPYDHISVSSQSGIVDLCGFPKDVYYYYKSWWTSEPVLHLFPHWNWAGKEGQNVSVWCYSNLDSVELFLNGKSLGSKPMDRNSHLQWSVSYEPGTIEVRGARNGRVVLTERRETTGAPAKLLLRSGRALTANGEDVTAIAVEVQDTHGRMIPTASNKVQFKVAGRAGKLLGVGNGDPSSRESDRPLAPDRAERSAFSGLCMVYVQATKQAGDIQLIASAEGLESAAVSIQSTAAPLRPAVS